MTMKVEATVTTPTKEKSNQMSVTIEHENYAHVDLLLGGCVIDHMGTNYKPTKEELDADHAEMARRKPVSVQDRLREIWSK